MKLYRLEHKVTREGPHSLKTKRHIMDNDDEHYWTIDHLSGGEPSRKKPIFLDLCDSDLTNAKWWRLNRLEFDPVCACDSTEQLYQWFGIHLDELISTGLFQIVEYEVPKRYIAYSKSGAQYMFARKHAKCLTTVEELVLV